MAKFQQAAGWLSAETIAAPDVFRPPEADACVPQLGNVAAASSQVRAAFAVPRSPGKLAGGVVWLL